MKTPYDKFTKIYTNCYGHIIKMADIPKYCKKNIKNLLHDQKADDIGTWFVTLGMGACQVCSNDDPRLTLTYLTSRSNLLP